MGTSILANNKRNRAYIITQLLINNSALFDLLNE